MNPNHIHCLDHSNNNYQLQFDQLHILNYKTIDFLYNYKFVQLNRCMYHYMA